MINTNQSNSQDRDNSPSIKKAEKLLPALFIGHGSPMNAITLNRYSLSWNQLGEQLPKPRAILVISAHWITPSMTAITAMDRPKTIHDFFGFPNDLVELEYNAKGAPFIASHIVKTLEEFVHIYEDYSDWGLDHGAWSVLANMYPDEDIPVMQLSLDLTKPISFHHEFGRALSELRRQGILLIGTGNVVHNLRSLKWELDQTPFTWAENFNQFVHENLDSHAFTDEHPLVNFQQHPDALLANPTIEHYIPMLYILGAWNGREQIRVFNNIIEQGSLSMLSFIVGDDELNLSQSSENLEGAAYGSYLPPEKLVLDFFAQDSNQELEQSNSEESITEPNLATENHVESSEKFSETDTESKLETPELDDVILKTNALEVDIIKTDNQENVITDNKQPTPKKGFSSKLKSVASKFSRR